VYRFRQLEHLHHHAPAKGMGLDTAWIHRRAAKGGFGVTPLAEGGRFGLLFATAAVVAVPLGIFAALACYGYSGY
jgi:hypothetical protein